MPARSAPESTTEHTWSRTRVTLVARVRLHGTSRNRHVRIDLRRFRCEPGSLLETALRTVPCPTSPSIAQAFRRMLERFPDGSRAIQILDTQMSGLRTHDIHQLLSAMEEEIEKRPSADHYLLANHTRSYFTQISIPLGDGRTIAQAGYKSRFTGVQKEYKTSIAGAYDAESMPSETQRPNNTIEFETLDERNAKFHAHGVARQSRIAEACRKSFTNHTELRSRIIELKGKDLPKLHPKTLTALREGGKPGKTTYKVLPEESKLQIALHIIDRDRLWESPWRTDITFSFTEITELHRHVIKNSNQRLLEALLSDYYLPRLTVTACLVAILLETALNAETVASLTPSSLQRVKGGYKLLGLKGRTGQLQSVDITIDPQDDDSTSVTAALAVEALDLLVWHANSIGKTTGLKNIPLLSGLKLRNFGHDQFSIGNLNQSVSEFFKYHGLKPFAIRQLRELSAHVDYLAPGGSIYSVNAKLNQKSLRTTALYLRSTIIQSLQEANILRFMKKLAATVLWLCDRKGELTRHQVPDKYIDRNLLFPIDFAGETTALSDKWLASDGSLNLEIGTDEVIHCVHQYNMYKADLRILAQSNPEQFIRWHLPRIVFCVALRRVIIAGPHKGVLLAFEEKWK